MFVVGEQALGQTNIDEHEAVVVFGLIDRKSAGDKRILVAQRQVRTEGRSLKMKNSMMFARARRDGARR